MPRNYISTSEDSIDLPNGYWIRARNAADTADIPVMRLNQSNTVELGTTIAMAGPTPFIDVRSKGAIGDGVTDDATAIQNAINALPADGGAIYLPEGKTYLVKSMITVPTNSVRFFSNASGAAPNATPNPAGARLQAGSPFTGAYVLSFGPTAGEASPIGYSSLENITVDAAGVSNLDGIRWTAHTSQASNVRVVRARDGWTFKGATGAAGWDLYDCRLNYIFAVSNTRNGFVLNDANCNDMHFLNCLAITNGQDGLYWPGASSGGTFIGCHFYGSTRYNMLLEGGGSYTRFDACRFDNCGQHGVVLDPINGNIFLTQFVNCSFARAGTSANNTYDCFLYQRTSGTNTSQRGLMVGCQFFSSAANKPRYAINLSVGSITKWSFDFCQHDGNMQTNIINDLTSDTSYRLYDANHILMQRFPSANGTRIGVAVSEKIGFYGATPIAKPTVTGAKGSNAALGSLMTALANLGIVVDSTSA